MVTMVKRMVAYFMLLFICAKNIFAAARMKFIFVTRCAGNKALFFGLAYRT